MGDEEQAGKGGGQEGRGEEQAAPSGEQTETRARPRRWPLLAAAALIPAVPVAIGIIVGLGQPGAGAAPAATATVGFTPVPSRPRAPAKPAASNQLPVPPGRGPIIAVLTRPTTLRTAPHGRSIARLGTKTAFGSPETVLVVRHVPGWLGVVASQAGNGHVGWIVQRGTALARITWQLKVSLSARRLSVLDGDRVVERFKVAIGRPGAPTPTGRFAVTDRLSTGDPAGPYGCCILALSAHSPHAIQGWGGGDRIAIHSTPDVASIGQAASHGCMRLTLAEGRWLLDHIPLGTPALISS